MPPSLFEELVDRRGTASMKWGSAAALLTPEEAAADPLPMWVADMDLRAPQPVLDALHAAVDHGVLGYGVPATDGHLAAVTGWQARRHGWAVDPDWVVPTAGVITAVKTAVQAFSSPGDSVLVQPPVYHHFHHDTELLGRRVVWAPLQRTEDGYRFDPDVLEAAIQPDTRVFVLSNPHNPTGNVWTPAELRAMGEACARRGVLVVSDEVHADLVLAPGLRHTPYASLGEDLASTSITCTSPSKTFNLAGLQCAHAVIPDARLRGAFTRQYERNQFPFLNTLGMVAAEAAYTHGEPWLEALLDHLRGNHAAFAEGVQASVPGVRVLPADSLYLAWTDCRALAGELGLDAAGLQHAVLTRARLWLDDGRKFGAEGHGYLRANLGCPRSTVTEAVSRLAAAFGEAARP